MCQHEKNPDFHSLFHLKFFEFLQTSKSRKPEKRPNWLIWNHRKTKQFTGKLSKKQHVKSSQEINQRFSFAKLVTFWLVFSILLKRDFAQLFMFFLSCILQRNWENGPKNTNKNNSNETNFVKNHDLAVIHRFLAWSNFSQ